LTYLQRVPVGVCALITPVERASLDDGRHVDPAVAVGKDGAMCGRRSSRISRWCASTMLPSTKETGAPAFAPLMGGNTAIDRRSTRVLFSVIIHNRGGI
jgi:hypothetical protein